jgi:hypothetical protein
VTHASVLRAASGSARTSDGGWPLGLRYDRLTHQRVDRGDLRRDCRGVASTENSPGSRLLLPGACCTRSSGGRGSVLPGQLEATLAEWHRILMPGGSLSLHTPNSSSIAAALVRPETFWAAQGAIVLYGRLPGDHSRPEGLGDSPDHRIVLSSSSCGTARIERIRECP